jgi:hypothetical protein
MLDRLASMPPEAISSVEVYERLKNIPIEYEIIEDAQLEGVPQTMVLTENNEQE